MEIKDSLSNNDKCLYLSFDFNNKIIGQFKIRYEAEPIQLGAHRCLSMLSTANDEVEFLQILLRLAKDMVDAGDLQWNTNGQLISGNM